MRVDDYRQIARSCKLWCEAIRSLGLYEVLWSLHYQRKVYVHVGEVAGRGVGAKQVD